MVERVKCTLTAYILDIKDAINLDEPTNHLDLPARQQLESTLVQYNGTILFLMTVIYFGVCSRGKSNTFCIK